MAIQRAFILGAGASISHAKGNFPGIADFFKFAKDLNIIEGKGSKNHAELFDYIERKYTRSIFNKRHNIDIEKILTLLEVDITSGGKMDYLSLRETILRLIVEVIQRQQLALATHNGTYELFRTCLQQRDLIISFNWDTLLDRCLAEASEGPGPALQGSAQWFSLKNRFIYGEQTGDPARFITHEKHMSAAEFDDPIASESEWEASYLKMHGSVDWVSCQNEMCPAKGYTFRILSPLSTYQCGYCFEPMQTVIVPPVLNKTLSKIAAIRRIWSYANRCIQAAEELVIWGYSLPPTDFYAENLLRRIRKKELHKVDIVNPAVVYKMHSGLRRNRRFIERFEDVVGLKWGHGLEIYESIEDWVGGTTAGSKYGFGST